MSLILSGTDGLSDVDGSASTPAIRGTDTNTGMFFPAADTLALGTNGTERMRITSTGNVGINNTPTFGLGSGLEVAPIDNGYVALSLKKGSAGAGHALDFVDSSDALQFRVGTNFASAGNNLIFAYGTTPTVGMLLNTSGNLLVGATSTVDSERVNVTQSGQFPTIYSNNTNATNAYGIRSNLSTYFFNTTSFLFDGIEFSNLRFRVYSNGGIGNYSGNDVNLSDQREKKNIELAPNYLDKICQIPVKTFLYINQTDTQKTLGVIAQDVQAIAPEFVDETDWSENADGSKMRLSIYQTDLQFALMKAIQELKAIVDAQAIEINELKARP